MLYYDVLDEIAEKVHIPNKKHKYLHVKPREAWVEIMVKLIESGYFKGSYKEIKIMAENWETLLYNRFSSLN